MAIQESWEVDSMNGRSTVLHSARMTDLRHLSLFYELGQIIKRCLVHGESVLVLVIIEAKCKSSTSEGIHCKLDRILFEEVRHHSMETKWRIIQLILIAFEDMS